MILNTVRNFALTRTPKKCFPNCEAVEIFPKHEYIKQTVVRKDSHIQLAFHLATEVQGKLYV